MNVLFSCIGRRGYLVAWFRELLGPGDRIVGTSNTRWTPGFAGCDRRVLMPDIASDEYLPAVFDLVEREGIDVLFSCFDPDVVALSPHRDRFVAMGVAAFIPDQATAQLCFDKLAAAEFLASNGFGGPATFASVAEALTAVDEGRLRFPVVIKERFGLASRGLDVATDAEELEVLFRRLRDGIVQERLDGQEHSLDVLTGLDGEVRAVVAKRKRVMRAGETDQAITVHRPELQEVGVRLGRALRAYGPMDVDLFVGGERIDVLEMNPRFGGAYPASHLAGADFPRKLLAMARGESVPTDLEGYRAGVGMMKDYVILPGPEEPTDS